MFTSIDAASIIGRVVNAFWKILRRDLGLSPEAGPGRRRRPGAEDPCLTSVACHAGKAGAPVIGHYESE